MFWALPMASRLGKNNKNLSKTCKNNKNLSKNLFKRFQCFNSFRKNVILLFLVFLVIRSTDLPYIVHYPVFLWLYGCFSLCFRLYVCAYWCIGVYIPMVILYVNDIVFLYWFLLVSLPLFCFYF